jgi:hypothetical protein
MFEMGRIECYTCSVVLYSQFLDCDDELHEHWGGVIYTLENDCMFCKDCVSKCKNCNTLICVDNSNSYCVSCEKIQEIQYTYNNITKSLPIELVYIILSMC